MKKKLFSILLSLAMVVTMMPAMTMTAFATGNEAKIGTNEYATLEAAIGVVQDDETIVMLQDVTYGTSITINNEKTFTIDFNNGSTSHTFTWHDTDADPHRDKDIFTIEGNSNVTVKNMQYKVSSDEYGNRIFKVNSTGTLTLKDMICDSADSIKDTPVRNDGGTVIIDGGNITINETGVSATDYQNALNPIVQNLGGTTTFKGNGTYTINSSSATAGAIWLGNIITNNDAVADPDSGCGTVIIENGTFNNGTIITANGKGNVTINNATHNGNTAKNAASTMIIYHGGIKSNITINNIISSTNIFAIVYEALETKIDLKNGNVKYKATKFCPGAGASSKAVSIKNGKFGPTDGTTDIQSEIQGFLVGGATLTALTDDPDGYTYKVETPHTHDGITFTAWNNSDSLPSTAGNYYLTNDITISGSWTAPNEINLCLNGHNIIRNGGNCITINNGGVLGVFDCSNTQHKFSEITDAQDPKVGLWVLDEINGTNVVTGGCIMGINPVAGQIDGIGVFINQGGTLNLDGGNVVGNYASNGAAGVFVGGAFTMNGGSVCGNKAYSNGGGVYVSGTFTMSGGSIDHNTATCGGGVYDDGTVTLGGEATITNNKANGENSNVYLINDKYITIGVGADVPTSGMNVGIKTQTIPTSSEPVAISNVNNSDYHTYFFADRPAPERVVYNTTDKKLYLAIPQPTPPGPTPGPEPTPPEEYTVPVESENTVQVEATIESGKATVKEITKEIIEEVTKPTAGKEKSDAIVIDLSKAKQDVTAVELTSKTVENLAEAVASKDNAVEKVTIQMAEATVELDAKTLETVCKEAEGDTIRLVVDKTQQEQLKEKQKETLSNYNVNKTFEAYFESNGQRISNFNGGKVVVGIKFTPDAGKKVGNYKVYYVDDEGKMQKFASKYADGMLKFSTTHFSDYAIVYEGTKDVLLLKAKISGSKAIKLSWNGIDNATKYVVYGAKCGNDYKKLKTVKGKSYTVKKISEKKLIAHKAYKFYVVGYDAAGNKVKSKSVHFITSNTYGRYANVKSIKAKYDELLLSVGVTQKIGAKYKIYSGKKHIKSTHGKDLRYISSNPEVAKVSSSGKVTAVSAGTATIYIQDIGGKYCKTKVTVER